MKYFLPLLFFIPFLSTGQTTFQKYYDVCGNALGLSIHELDKGYLVFGENSQEVDCFSFLLLDSIGEVRIQKEIEVYSFARKRALAKDLKGSVYITGITATKTHQDSFLRDIFLLKISPETLDTFWTRRYLSIGDEDPVAIQKTKNGVMILSEKSIPYVDSDGNIYRDSTVLYFMEVDTSGHIIAEHNVKTEFRYTLAGDFDFLENKEIAVIYDAGDNYLFTDAHIGVLDSNFQFKWKEKLIESHASSRPTLSVSRDKKQIYPTCQLNEYAPSTGTTVNGKVYAYDLSGNIIWEQSLLSRVGYEIYINDIAENEDILVCGYDRRATMAEDYGRLSRISKSGKVIWDRMYKASEAHSKDESQFRQVIETKDGGVLAVGFIKKIKPSGRIENDIEVLKLNADGCMVPGCDSVVLTSVQVSSAVAYPTSSIAISVRPNPSSGEFSFSFPKLNEEGILSIINASGVLVAQKTIESNTTELVGFPERLAPGIYFYRLSSGSLHTGGRLVVSR